MNVVRKIWVTSKYSLLILAVAVIIGFTNSKLSSRRINEVSISIDNQFENYFINQDDVLQLINERGKQYLLNSSHRSLDLKELETRIEHHQFVKDAEAYVDLEGNLSIDVEQNRPIARVVDTDGPDYYIGIHGDVLPESDRYTARVMLIELEDENWLPEFNVYDAEYGEEIFEFIQTVASSKFWNAQIAGMYIKRNMEIVLQPQVTKQVIEFGRPKEVDAKLRKLMTFYKQILPYKGWNAFDTVNLKFKNQIVCKK